MTCSARVPARLRTGALCLLVDTVQGLVLVDAGLGRNDYIHRTAIMRVFRLATKLPLDPEQAVANQLPRLGYVTDDVRHIVLTHMHFDHAGGVPDFPGATVHVHKREYEAYTGHARAWTDLGYVRRHMAHGPTFALYEDTGEQWSGFRAIRLPFEPAMWLVPFFGHTRGHCGVAIETEEGWLLHTGDAASVGFDDALPDRMVRVVLGPHASSLRSFGASHPEMRLTAGHMPLDFFAEVGE